MRLHQVAQRATDLARATEWYGQLLNTEPLATFDPPGLVFFDLDGTRLLLDRAAPSALLYLAVEDLDSTIDRLRSAGTPIDTEPHTIFRHDDDTLGPSGTDERMAFVRDSEDNLVGLVGLVHS